MRNQKIIVTTQALALNSKRISHARGEVKIVLTRGFNEPANSIEIEGRREEALINITFERGEIWSGTIHDLRKKLI